MATAQQQAQQRKRQRAAAAASVAAAGAAVAAPPAAVGITAAVAAKQVADAFIGFLAVQRQRDQSALAAAVSERAAGLRRVASNDLARVAQQEAQLGAEFEKRSAARVAAALPSALALDDPIKRDAAVRTILEAEHRFARQRSEAMFSRASSAVERMHLREVSPQGALWRLGVRTIHCPICRFMGGGTVGNGRFWPWLVLDPMHPPVHGQCGCTLHSFGEALANGWMTPADVQDPEEALKMAQGIVLPPAVSEALLDEHRLRVQLVEMGLITVEADAGTPYLLGAAH